MKDVRTEETADSPLFSAPFFFPCGKSYPNYRASLRACALLRWTEATRREADRSESGCWEMAQKKTLASLFSVLSTHHFSAPPALCPSAQALAARAPVRGYLCF